MRCIKVAQQPHDTTESSSILEFFMEPKTTLPFYGFSLMRGSGTKLFHTTFHIFNDA